MERNANYALVGFASLMLFVGLVVFIVWLARIQFTHNYDTYDVLFMGPVNGLSQGGEVHFNGIKVGEITDIALDSDDPKMVDARVRVTSDVPIRADSYATAEPEGITGVNFIQITPGSTTTPLLKTLPHKGKYPVIHSRESTLSGLLSGGGAVLASTAQALKQVNSLLSDQNIALFDSTLRDVKDVADEARRRKELFSDADQAVKSIDTAAASIKKLSDTTDTLVDSDGRRTFHNAADAAADIKDVANQTKAMIAKLQGPTTDFAANGLPALTSAVASLQQAADSLNRLASQLEESPTALISKPPAKEVQVKP